MNHYPHHIGDFNNATRHLTRVERSLYRDLLDLYYDTEQPLNGDFNRLARRVLANTDDERVALQIVLDEFFTLEDDGWHNPRCDAEIEKYQSSIEQASRAGKASAAKRSANRSNATATTVERPLNDRTTNQNQNQNQNQNTPQTPQGGAPDGAGGVEPTFPDDLADLTPIETSPSAGSACTTAGSVCLAMKAAGIADTNPGNPKLRALVDAGADLQEFVGAAQQAVSAGNGRFAYVLGIVEGGRKRAAAMASQLHQGAMPAAETAYQRSMRERVQEFAPSLARTAPAAQQPRQSAAEFFNAIEVPSRTVGALK